MTRRWMLVVDAAMAAQRRDAVRAAAASLPQTYAVDGRTATAAPTSEVGVGPAAGQAHVVVVDGTRPAWGVRLAHAARAGARAAVVVDPVVDDGADPPIPVVVDRVYARRRALDAVRPRVADTDVGAMLEVDAVASADADLHAELVGMLALARACGGVGYGRLRPVARTSRTVSVDGELADGRRVHVCVVCTNALLPAARVRVIDRSSMVVAELPGGGTARPGVVRVVTDAGMTTIPTPWQTAHRVALLRAAEAAAGTAPGDDLGAVTADISVVRRLLS